MKKRVLCIAGTRPEIIKMAPVIRALRATPWAEVVVAGSGQHQELAESAFAAFGIAPDLDLAVMAEGQTLGGLTGRLFEGLEPLLRDAAPDLVVAQGDTTTVMAVATSCYYLGIPFAHVEAGLRTGNLRNPFPEEFNRIVCGRLAALHFAPTEVARRALLAESVAPGAIALTGNTVIDALLATPGEPPAGLDPACRLILLTAHRRENFGAPLEGIFRALRDVVAAHADVQLLYPVHPNPAVAETARRVFAGAPRVLLAPPLGYAAFVGAMRRAYLIVSDSGGVQEEAPALGKPVVVIRTETERPEVLAAGSARLVGTNPDGVRGGVEMLLDDDATYRAMAKPRSPYGDGHAAERIVDAVEVYLGLKPRRAIADFEAAES